MCDAGDGAGFVAKPFDSAARRVHELAREELDGDGPIESRIARTVDFTHSPGPEGCQDLERAEAGARGEPHCRELATGRVDREYNDLAPAPLVCDRQQWSNDAEPPVAPDGRAGLADRRRQGTKRG